MNVIAFKPSLTLKLCFVNRNFLIFIFYFHYEKNTAVLSNLLDSAVFYCFYPINRGLLLYLIGQKERLSP